MRKTPAIVVGALSLLVALSACGTSGASPAASPAATSPGTPTDPSTLSGITAHGTGHVAGAPDVVTITIGVQTSGAHATDALSANASRAGAVIAALKGHGVADADLQTSQLSLYPQYDSQGAVIRSYQATDTVTAKLHDINKAGGVIDAAVAAAGDAGRLQGVSFSFNDDSQLLAQARGAAVAAAKAQAQQLADGAGVKLGTLRSLSEDTTQSPLYPLGAAASGASAAPTPIQSGTAELTVRVTAVWNLA
jgi:uncharacterized protein YggE